METRIIKAYDLTASVVEELKHAAEVIKNGGLVVFPTETVYGLGADGTSSEGAKKIYQAKGRPSDNPLIIHIASPSDAEKYTYTNETYNALAKAFMPGPITVVLPTRENIPPETRAGLPTVAVRCPENLIARKLIELAGVPVAAPSANLSGSPSPTNASHVIDDMNGRVDIIIDGGNCEIGLESTIVKIEEGGELTLLRPGKITVEDLLRVVDTVRVADAVTAALKEGEKVLSPGMKYRHYAPKAPLYLLDGDREKIASYISEKSRLSDIAVIAYRSDVDLIKSVAPDAYIYEFGEREDELSHAKLLFNILRDADKHSFKEIYAPLPKKSGVGLALYNRMIRAAAYHIIRM